MLPPGPTGQATEIATVLVVGALAILAGHGWGLLVVVIADAMLMGRVWPIIAFPDSQTSLAVGSATLALLCAVPGLVLLRRVLPRAVALLLGPRPRHWHEAAVASAAILLAIWVVLPAF